VVFHRIMLSFQLAWLCIMSECAANWSTWSLLHRQDDLSSRLSILVVEVLFFFRSGTDLVSLLVLFLLGQGSVTSNRILIKFGSAVKHASIDRVTFSILRHNFKMAAMTSFLAEKCCLLGSDMQHLPSAYGATSTSS